MPETTTFSLNGTPVAVAGHPLRRLLDVLRDDFQLTGTKEACGEGECGACSILLDGCLANSCLLTLGQVAERSVVTIEGYAQTKRWQVLSQAFAEAGAVQCGFCTPGMLLAAEALLAGCPQPTEAEVRRALAGNLCRCTGYAMIVDGVLMAAKAGDGLW